MSKFKITLTTGLAMFAMFFGSGNLVFPLKIGIQTTDQYLLACLGLIITGVTVPFLGLFSMIIYQGNRDKYFGLLGKRAPFILSLLMLSLLGPFGVVPRCIIVAYGGVSLLWPELPFILFSAIFSFAILGAIWHKNKFIPIIGKWLGPFKIAGIVLIIIAAIKQSPPLTATNNPTNPILIGLTEGYQTMDLLAAFFFSITIIEYLRTICATKEEALKISLSASIIGASLIAIIYLGFIALGAYYSPYLSEIKPEQYLATIAYLTLGKYATLILAITMFLACLTTASSLSRLFAQFLRQDIAKNKISWQSAIGVTIVISFLLSLTGFDAIYKILGTLLQYIYPALIVLAITSILHKYIEFKLIKQSFWASILIALIYQLLH